MEIDTTIPPPRRADLVLRPMGEDGSHVVKDPKAEAFFNLGPQEAYLLGLLDGQHTVRQICTAFAQRFGEPFAPKDLDEFLTLAKAQHFLNLPPPRIESGARRVQRETQSAQPGTALHPPRSTLPAPTDPLSRQSLFYWRKSLFDPDHFFTWLAPKVAFFWTRTFLILSLAGALLALVVLIANWGEVMKHLPRMVRWETVLLAWVALFVVTTLHEFAHGLTCKRHGGEVHEIGFLLMFFVPCFYCNVSDAWLMREKAKRLWVTLAGGYCDLCMWALAVLVWRVALPGTWVHYLTWVLMTVCGIRVFLNFNPLIKLDGYYLLSDWLEIPNLRQRAWAALAARVRWLLWGAEKPAPAPRGAFLFFFGLASWLFTLIFLSFFVLTLGRFLGTRWGLVGVGLVACFAWFILPGIFAGFSNGEVSLMFKLRRKRTLVWLGLLLGIPALLFLWPMEDRASGSFKIRPAQRAEVRAPVSGFLRLTHVDEGDKVASGDRLVTFEVPDLASKLAQKQAEVHEVQAKLRLLEAGPRPEEIHEQRQRVARAQSWRDLAQHNLKRKQAALKEELQRLAEQVGQAKSEFDFAQTQLGQARKLLEQDALPREKFREADKAVQISQAQFEQAQAQKRAREAQGTLEDEDELARRDKELADAQATLALLEAGTRPEEIDAEKARLARLREEVYYFKSLQEKSRVASPVCGVIVTPRLREKVGQFLREGDLICEVEDPFHLEAEIPLEEQEVAKVRPGHPVVLKVRALPYQTFHATVDRIAPCAKGEKTEVQCTVTLSCRLRDASDDLRPGMTGYARVSCGRGSVASILTGRVLRYLRTEFWW